MDCRILIFFFFTALLIQEFHEVPYLKKFKFKRQDRAFPPSVAPTPVSAPAPAKPVVKEEVLPEGKPSTGFFWGLLFERFPSPLYSALFFLPNLWMFLPIFLVFHSMLTAYQNRNNGGKLLMWPPI